ncbi:hypothetical protein [Superficieibacter sp.]|uniref:BigA/YdbA N-terminal beta-barrel domain-containing protein n=1 Tax=Superficieibacter sp. TaxID=2303322 RepID=UPI0028B186D5|nr:hypothetical protein [Superficieibacter sp.]
MKYISRTPASRRSAISLCIALALQATPVWADEVETIRSLNKGNQSSCPKDIKSLTKEQKAKLPATCLKEEPSFLEENWEWVAGGIATVAAAFGIAVSNDDDGDDNHHRSDTPLPPDNGDATPLPPDNGDDTPLPPDNGDDTPLPPDNDGDTPLPPDDGSDTPTPPAPHAPGTASFTNGVEWDEASSTLTIKGVAWSYNKNADGTYTLTHPATAQTAVLVNWTINDDGTITLTGKNADGSKNWLYDNTGTRTW